MHSMDLLDEWGSRRSSKLYTQKNGFGKSEKQAKARELQTNNTNIQCEKEMEFTTMAFFRGICENRTQNMYNEINVNMQWKCIIVSECLFLGEFRFGRPTFDLDNFACLLWSCWWMEMDWKFRYSRVSSFGRPTTTKFTKCLGWLLNGISFWLLHKFDMWIQECQFCWQLRDWHIPANTQLLWMVS